jgi:hypothetical protein
MEEPICCPECGNRGREDDGWDMHARVPFRLIERVLRSWEFTTVKREDGSIRLMADTDSDKVDWESGNGLSLECCACFRQFPIPEGLTPDFG